MTPDPVPDSAEVACLHREIGAWFDANARDLPWRADASPWGVMVSEFMLQQTPVNRVLPAYTAWMDRWPTPAALAADSSGEAVRAWGRLGYPRRALRLHAAAVAIVELHEGQVPDDYHRLLTLPGVGGYTAAAIASFAFGARHVVLDTNIRRVFARVVGGVEFPLRSVTATERELASQLMPEHEAARWAAATMELGALVCTARSPNCEVCPVADRCRWLALGRPADPEPRRGQSWDGTDRQCRGRLMAVLRESEAPVRKRQLDGVWPDAMQRERCLDSLVKDGLVDPIGADQYALPQ